MSTPTGPSGTEVAVLAATAVTALFTGWAIFQRWLYTSRPFWVAPRLTSVAHGRFMEGKPVADLEWKIENRGNAPAHDVSAFIHDGVKWLEIDGPSTAIIDPREAVSIGWVVSTSGLGSYDPTSGRVDPPMRYDWTPLRVELRWRQHPSIRFLRRRRWKLPRPLE